jgi:hypothetical protein
VIGGGEHSPEDASIGSKTITKLATEENQEQSEPSSSLGSTDIALPSLHSDYSTVIGSDEGGMGVKSRGINE